MNKLLEFFILLLTIVNGGYGMKMQADIPKNELGSDTQRVVGTVLETEARKPVPGEPSMENLLFTAMQPLGTTMYVWGIRFMTGWTVRAMSAGLFTTYLRRKTAAVRRTVM